MTSIIDQGIRFYKRKKSSHEPACRQAGFTKKNEF